MHRLYISSLNTEGDRTKNMALEGHKISSYIKLPYYLTFICCLGRTLLGAFKDIRTLLNIAVSRAHYWVLQRSSLFDGLIKNTQTTPFMYLVKEFSSFNWQAHLHGKIIQRDCFLWFSFVEMKHWKRFTTLVIIQISKLARVVICIISWRRFYKTSVFRNFQI